ncbi:MAG: carboxylating nicotinate-nucleotide diphosphorylase [Deltaproteobacteria bacterium]|jgi:nicotinate-nucleotide pyrophosphorylase (carboxylating)|nr:carboxylating nicotinate-nucleotide diphosphorylase [Deltaproteobacteria bacterium]
MQSLTVAEIVTRALAEDIGPGDITTNLVVPFGTQADAAVVARERLVVSGATIAKEVFSQVDDSLICEIVKSDGQAVEKGDLVLKLKGNAASILTAERTALNFLMRLSGIASLTRRFVEAIGTNGPKLLDTRKTTPGLRVLEKAAVRHGGGENHRFALYDGILIKDNHIVSAGGIQKALAMAKALAPAGLKIEIEVETIAEELEALKGGADILLLDNMDPPTLQRAVKEANNFFAPNRRRVLLEASGGVSLNTISQIALSGVDYISAGAITHSAPSADLALDFYSRGTGS